MAFQFIRSLCFSKKCPIRVSVLATHLQHATLNLSHAILFSFSIEYFSLYDNSFTGSLERPWFMGRRDISCLDLNNVMEACHSL